MVSLYMIALSAYLASLWFLIDLDNNIENLFQVQIGNQKTSSAMTIMITDKPLEYKKQLIYV